VVAERGGWEGKGEEDMGVEIPARRREVSVLVHLGVAPSRCERGKLGEARCSMSGWDPSRSSQTNPRQTRPLDTLTPWQCEEQGFTCTSSTPVISRMMVMDASGFEKAKDKGEERNVL
jgi:hypothetical protein